MTALATGHSSLTQYVRRCAILTGVTAISDCTTLGFMIIFLDKAPIPLLATVYVSYLVKGVVVEILLKQFRLNPQPVSKVTSFISIYEFVSKMQEVTVRNRIRSLKVHVALSEPRCVP